jgi:opacity protein-like surface antigen
MTRRVAALVIVAVLITPSEAHGQRQPGFSGYAVFGDMRLDAAQTFEAVSGTRRTRIMGAGIQVTNVWKSLFVDLGVLGMTRDGERVFIDEDGIAQPLGIALEVRMRFVDVAAGWRIIQNRLSPYIGAGFSRLNYRETSELARPGEDVAESGTGPLVLTGVDFTLSRWIRIGAELRYRRIGGVLGSGGASANFDENSAGGLSIAVRMAIGR